MPNKPVVHFPKRFLWGVSTSAHQVEGNTHNQWSEWEVENAASLAAQALYQFGDLDNWPAIKADAVKPNNYVSGAAVEHYERYVDDFVLARQLNCNAFRFSVEWSRIEPREGAWDAAEIEHYKKYVLAMRKAGLEPVITLFHFTLPVWFAEMGGFTKRTNVKFFVRFAEKIISELGVNVKYIITINEPQVYAHESYLAGVWPPQVQSRKTFLLVLQNLALAHRRVAVALHALNRRYKVSVAKNSAYCYAGDDALLSRKTADFMQYFQDDYFLHKIVKYCDFLGVNYYFSNRVYGYRVHNPEQHVSDMGWDMQPENLELVLERLWDRYHLPMIITENGLADADDEQRGWWLVRSVSAMHAALEYGVKLEGYLHWSLLDNFEWDKGFWPRFGLVAVDRATMTREIRPSARAFARLIKKLQRK
ncbi:MAG TPA: family 1 glycosylhydrolase [Candidatus Saccharimonadaceae bacterium]|nr:family 1 glycosylhydrolase [Candidatus Saccharimonadaceae bacterium]